MSKRNVLIFGCVYVISGKTAHARAVKQGKDQIAALLALA